MTTQKYHQAVGRRKTSIAQARLFEGGRGTITINKQEYKAYFPVLHWQESVTAPLRETGKTESVDVIVFVKGGGKSGQSDAVKLAIARALIKYDAELKSVLKAHDLLTRDARKKERKKFGKRGARRSPQWRKR